MTKITYNALGDIVCETESPRAKDIIEFEGVPRGRITVGGRTYAVENGIAELDAASLGDGRWAPVLNYCGKRLTLQAIEKQGARLRAAAPDAKDFLRLVKRAGELEGKVAELSALVGELSLLVKGSKIFDIK